MPFTRWEMDLYRKKVMVQLMPAFSRLKGIMAGTIIDITTSSGAPMNRGVKIIFMPIMAKVCVKAPQTKAMIAVFLVLFRL